MGIWDVYLDAQKAKRHFDLRDLGVLDGPPPRGALTIVDTVGSVLSVPIAAFLTFDDEKSCVSVRASTSIRRTGEYYSSTNSIASQTRLENATQSVNNMRAEASDAPESESLGAAALLAAPVYGPSQEAVGVLAAVRDTPHYWSKGESRILEDLAHLISQEILLRASIQTLKIMSSERSWLST